MEGRELEKGQKEPYLGSILPGIFIGTLLVICGFLAGWYWEQANVRDEITVKVVASEEEQKEPLVVVSKGESVATEEIADEGVSEDCVYIGSKNSDQYHLAESGTAKRIKEENRLCFATQEEAEDEGYDAGDVD